MLSTFASLSVNSAKHPIREIISYIRMGFFVSINWDSE